MSILFKDNGLVPAIIQDAQTRQVLMLGYMNEEALTRTRAEGRVVFYSRSKQRLWMKGESSGNILDVIEIKEDCDQDTLLILVRPRGPVCHTGSDTCFGQRNLPDFLGELEAVIKERKASPSANSYTCSLFEQGLARIAQKVGEEAVEVVIAAMADERTRLKEESADLLFHLLVLLREKDISWQEVLEVLKGRH